MANDENDQVLKELSFDGVTLEHPWDSISLVPANRIRPEVQNEFRKKLSFCSMASGKPSQG